MYLMCHPRKTQVCMFVYVQHWTCDSVLLQFVCCSFTCHCWRIFFTKVIIQFCPMAHAILCKSTASEHSLLNRNNFWHRIPCCKWEGICSYSRWLWTFNWLVWLSLYFLMVWEPTTDVLCSSVLINGNPHLWFTWRTNFYTLNWEKSHVGVMSASGKKNYYCDYKNIFILNVNTFVSIVYFHIYDYVMGQIIWRTKITVSLRKTSCKFNRLSKVWRGNNI